jgi:hypothetical protein
MYQFFNKLGLDISINGNIEQYFDLFDHVKVLEPIAKINDLIDELDNSFEIEGEQLSSSQIEQILASKSQNIETIHKIIIGKKQALCKRRTMVYVTNEDYKIIHYGMKPSKIDYERLQKWVNLFYKTKFRNNVERIFVGFILYLLYERIHPHEDGNGRIGRYLFLENKQFRESQSLFPFAQVLSKLKYPNDIMKYLFIKVSNNDKDQNEDFFYSLFITGDMFNKIVYLIYITMLFRMIITDDLLLNITDEPLFCELLTKGGINRLSGRTIVSDFNPNFRKQILSFIKRLNKKFDFNTHKKILSEIL